MMQSEDQGLGIQVKSGLPPHGVTDTADTLFRVAGGEKRPAGLSLKPRSFENQPRFFENASV